MENFYKAIEDALILSPEFSQKLSYWVNKRNRVPETKWILGELVKIYGKKVLKQKLNPKV